MNLSGGRIHPSSPEVEVLSELRAPFWGKTQQMAGFLLHIDTARNHVGGKAPLLTHNCDWRGQKRT